MKLRQMDGEDEKVRKEAAAEKKKLLLLPPEKERVSCNQDMSPAWNVTSFPAAVLTQVRRLWGTTG